MSTPNPFRDELERRRTGATPEAEDTENRFSAELSQREGEAPEPEGSFGERLVAANVASAQNINTAIIDALSLPGDLMNGLDRGFRAITGLELPEGVEQAPSLRERARGAAAEAGIAPEVGEEPQTAGARATRFATTALMPVAPVLRMATVPRLMASPQSFGQAAGQRIMQDVSTRPARATAAETTMAAGAGGLGRVTEEHAGEFGLPDDELAARAVGELFGGLGLGAIGAAGPSAGRAAKAGAQGGVNLLERLPVSGPFIRFVRRNLSAFDSGRSRMGRFIDDPEASATAAETGDPRLTPAERTGEPGLATLQRTAEETSPELRRGQQQRRSRVAGEMEQETRGMFGAPQQFRQFLQRRVEASLRNMDRRMRSLSPDAEPEDQARIVAREIDGAHRDARARERRTWDNLQRDEAVNISGVHERWQGVLSDEAAVDQLPGFLRAKLGRFVETEEGETVFQRGSLGSDPSFEQLKTLRSQILRTRRQMQRGSEADRNQLRLLGDVEDEILNSMRAIGADDVDEAIGVSRAVNRTFREGQVGQLRRGVLQERPSTTLETTVTGRPAERAEKVRDLLRAAEQSDDPQAVTRARQGVEEYLKNVFVTQVDPDGSGAPNPRAIRNFLRQNRVLLEDFPDLHKRIRNAKSARELVNQRTGQLEQEILPWRRKKAATTLFLEANPNAEIAKVTSAQSGMDPTTGFRSLVSEARQGGDAAFQGLQGAFVDHLFDQARTGEALAVSGRRFVAELDRLADSARQSGLLTDEQLSRLRVVGRNLQSMEGVERAEPARGGVMADEGVASWMRRSLQIVGAGVARSLMRGTSAAGTVQIPGKGSEIAASAGETMIVDRAENMVKEAILANPKLFRSMTTDIPSASESTQRRVERTVRPFWTLGVATGEEE